MAAIINISDVKREFVIGGSPGAIARVVALDPGQRADGIPDTLIEPIKGSSRKPLPSIVHQLSGGHVVPVESDAGQKYLAGRGKAPLLVSQAAGTKPGSKPLADDDGDIPEVTGN